MKTPSLINPYKGFGQRLRLYRKARGLTQGVLARRVGVSQIQIHRYESGKQFPGYVPLFKLCWTLEASADSLMGLLPMEKT